MPMIDLFSGNAFQALTLTDAINVIPNTYGRVTDLGIFQVKNVPTTTAAVEFKRHILNLLNTAARGGGKGTVAQAPKRTLRDFRIPHIPHNDFIYADDVQNVRAFGEEAMLQQLQEAVDEKLLAMANKHDITLEHLLCSALRGQVLDADGAVLLDLFTEFGVTEQVFTFTFTNVNFDVSQEIVRMKRYYEMNLFGETLTGLHVLCSPEWFEALISHPKMVAAYDKYASNQEPLREDVRNRFVHKGVVFEEYVGRASVLNGDGSSTTRLFIPANTARVVPLGTNSTFRLFYGPADYLTTVNQPGQSRYARILPDPGDRFITIETQQNPLPVVLRPQLLVRMAMN